MSVLAGINKPLAGIVVLVIWNLFVFILYAADKVKAKQGRWRIPEKSLITTALLFGGVGALAGMQALHHKTRHTKFKVLVPIGFIITVALFIGVVWCYL